VAPTTQAVIASAKRHRERVLVDPIMPPIQLNAETTV
jgi:hypothetical protein